MPIEATNFKPIPNPANFLVKKSKFNIIHCLQLQWGATISSENQGVVLLVIKERAKKACNCEHKLVMMLQNSYQKNLTKLQNLNNKNYR